MLEAPPARRFRCATTAALCGILLASMLAADAQSPITALVTGKKPTQSAAPASPAPAAVPQAEVPAAAQVIPLPDIAVQSEQLGQKLADISASLPSAEDLKVVNAAITEHGATLQTKRREVDNLLSGTATSIELREQENYWRGFQNFSAGWRKQLLGWANAAQAAVDQLDKLEPQWSATLEAYKGQPELAPVLELIHENLAAIRKLRSQSIEGLQALVKMQITVAAQDQAAGEVLTRLDSAQDVFTEGLLHRDSLPFWQLGSRRQQGENLSLYSTARSRWITITAFANEHPGVLALLLVLLLVSLGIAYRLRAALQSVQPQDETQSEALLLARRWIALGVMAPLLVGYALAPSAPLSLIGLVVLVSFFPILRLLAPLVLPRYRLMLYCLAAYYAFSICISWAPFSAVIKREVGFVVTLALFLTLAYMLRPLRHRPAGVPALRHTVLLFAARAAVLALGISLASNMLGYVRLAQYVGLACFYSGFIGLSMYTGTRVYTTLLRAALRLPQAERLAVARLHREALLRWIPRILVCLAFLVWLSATLDLLRIREDVTAALQSVLDFHIAGSASEITLGGVLGFFLMLALGYVIATAARFFLREEVFNRFNLSRGLPDLIASTVYYLLLLLVFLIAVNAGGVQLNKFTLLTGALGVGFGFGMQNIINNFVSGLILQYERPIHINDILEVEGYTGKVTRIGVRSSTLQTFQGAEVIIPNANLISGKVVNWTLTEQKRRAELALGVAYGTDPKAVLNYLLDAANKHESVLTEPAPMAYFMGFGDSSLNFELHFWVMQESSWYRVRSEIAMEVMKRLEEAGIEIPFPQRDLHIRSVPEGAAQGDTSELTFGDHARPEPPGSPAKRKAVTADGD